MQAVGDQQSSPFRIRRSRRTLKLCLLFGRPDAHATLTHSKQNIVHRTNDECSPHVRPTARTRSSRRPVFDSPQRSFAKRQATKGCTLTFDQLRVTLVFRSHRSNWSTIIRSKKPHIREDREPSLARTGRVRSTCALIADRMDEAFLSHVAGQCVKHTHRTSLLSARIERVLCDRSHDLCIQACYSRSSPDDAVQLLRSKRIVMSFRVRE